jgi:hypothetical protein
MLTASMSQDRGDGYKQFLFDLMYFTAIMYPLSHNTTERRMKNKVVFKNLLEFVFFLSLCNFRHSRYFSSF